jgi:hypothetical protein
MKRPAAGEPNDSLAPDFLDFVICLNAHDVDYVLVGGYALGVHGVVRATGDIDFLYRRAPENVRRLCEAMEEFGAPPVVIDYDVLMMPDRVTMFGSPPYRIDLLSDISGVTFEQVWAGCLQIEVQGQLMRVIGPEELRLNKAATGRRKDADDLRKLRASASDDTASPEGSGTGARAPRPRGAKQRLAAPVKSASSPKRGTGQDTDQGTRRSGRRLPDASD